MGSKVVIIIFLSRIINHFLKISMILSLGQIIVSNVNGIHTMSVREIIVAVLEMV